MKEPSEYTSLLILNKDWETAAAAPQEFMPSLILSGFCHLHTKRFDIRLLMFLEASSAALFQAWASSNNVLLFEERMNETNNTGWLEPGGTLDIGVLPGRYIRACGFVDGEDKMLIIGEGVRGKRLVITRIKVK